MITAIQPADTYEEQLRRGFVVEKHRGAPHGPFTDARPYVVHFIAADADLYSNHKRKHIFMTRQDAENALFMLRVFAGRDPYTGEIV